MITAVQQVSGLQKQMENVQKQLAEQAEETALQQEARDKASLEREDTYATPYQNNANRVTQNLEDNTAEAKAKTERDKENYKNDHEDETIQMFDTYMLFPVKEKWSDKAPDWSVNTPKADGKGFNNVGAGWTKTTKSGGQMIIIKRKIRLA